MLRGLLFLAFGLGLIGVGTKNILDDRKNKSGVIDAEVVH